MCEILMKIETKHAVTTMFAIDVLMTGSAFSLATVDCVAAHCLLQEL